MKKTRPILILQNESVTLCYHPDTKVVHHQFHKFVYGRVFREALDAGAEALKKYGAEKWLSDDRKNGPLVSKDKQWADEEWLPRVRAAGWKYWAIVLPQDVLGQMSMQKVAQGPGDQGIATRLFSDPAEAMAWLESQ